MLKYLYLANRYYQIAIQNEPSNPFLYFRLASTIKSIYLSPEYRDVDEDLGLKILNIIENGKIHDKNKIYWGELNQIILDLEKAKKIKKVPYVGQVTV